MFINSHFFLKLVLHAFNFFISFLKGTLKIFWTNSGIFLEISQFWLESVYIHSILNLLLFHCFDHFIILSLTHCHSVFKTSLSIFPLLSFKVVLLLNIFKTSLSFKHFFISFFKFCIELLDLWLIFGLHISQKTLMIFLLWLNFCGVLSFFLLIVLNCSFKKFDLLLL